MHTTQHKVGAVVIGRNEGARLVACLESTRPQVDRMVYVDSGSTDGSVATARDLGAEVVELDMSKPFTAARARNAGAAWLRETGYEPEFLQFIDGDCELDHAWVATARPVLEADSGLAVVCGRRRERHPEASVYNRLADAEWDTPIGPARACGGDALMRRAAFDAVGGFDPHLIAGEEPELCLRLRREGWGVLRIDAEMTHHDAAMTRFGQWWKRAVRAGHAFAEGAYMHGTGAERHWVAEARRALAWGAGVPSAALLVTALVGPIGLAILLLWPIQVSRLGPRVGWERAIFLTLGKMAEAQGVLDFHIRRLLGRPRGLIEYK